MTLRALFTTTIIYREKEHFDTSNSKERRLYNVRGKEYSFKLNAFGFIKNSLHRLYFARFATD